MKTDRSLKNLMRRRTVIVRHGEVWTARDTPEKNPQVLVEIARRYPGAMVLNAMAFDQARKVFREARPAV